VVDQGKFVPRCTAHSVLAELDDVGTGVAASTGEWVAQTTCAPLAASSCMSATSRRHDVNESAASGSSMR